jgi:hypothetical protein
MKTNASLLIVAVFLAPFGGSVMWTQAENRSLHSHDLTVALEQASSYAADAALLSQQDREGELSSTMFHSHLEVITEKVVDMNAALQGQLAEPALSPVKEVLTKEVVSLGTELDALQEDEGNSSALERHEQKFEEVQRAVEGLKASL